MTTNHQAHGPVSLDRLHQIREILSKAAAQSDGGNLGYAMADAVKVIDGAIASFDAEPVGYADPQAFVNFKSMGGKNAACTKEWMWRDPYNGLIPLYTAPPATVVPDEMTPVQASRTYGGEVRGYRDGWNACRAAMLHNGNSPVIPDGWVACSERMPEDDTLCIAIDDIGVVWTAHYDDGVMAPDIPCSSIPEFTHWMPLPAAPQQDA